MNHASNAKSDMFEWGQLSALMGRVFFALMVPVAFTGLAWCFYWLAGALEGALAGWHVPFTNGLMIPPSYGAAIANVVTLMAVTVMTIAAGLTVGERKWSAMMQNRIGPNRIRVFGLFVLGGMPFLIADALKMLTKENLQPARSSKLLYNLAPLIAFAPSFVLFAVVPVGPAVAVEALGRVHTVALQVASIDAGLLFVFGAASLAVYGTALAGWASNNKLAILGGVRAASQMISYEVSLGLSLAGAMMAYGTLRLEEMVRGQGQLLWGGVPALGLLLQPVGLLVFFVSAFAETKRAPFDLPEGESEIVGYFVEYPGMKFGMMFLGEFIEVVVLAAITATVFLGGWHPVLFEQFLQAHLSPLWFAAVCAGAFLTKVMLLCWLQLVIRWTLPRFRFDQIQRLCWKMLLPLCLANVFLTAALVLLDPTLELLALVGLVELVAMVAVTVAVTRKAAPAARPQHAPAAHAAAGH